MDMPIYERPREKLQNKGVSALTNTELLQVLIGSGNAGMPVTRIARKVDKLLNGKGSTVTLNELVTVPGLGTVKAGQLMAGFELARRLNGPDKAMLKPASLVDSLYVDIREAKRQTLLYAFYDGQDQHIEDYSSPISSTDNTARMVRTIFAEALAQSAASILIAVGCKQQSLEPAMHELNLARDAHSMAKLLSLPLKSFVLVGQGGTYVIKEAKNGK
jgi:DNA repair protein RadC